MESDLAVGIEFAMCSISTSGVMQGCDLLTRWPYFQCSCDIQLFLFCRADVYVKTYRDNVIM